MNKTCFRIVIFLATIGMIIFLSVPEVDAKGGGVARRFNTKMALVRLANTRKTRTNGVSTKKFAKKHWKKAAAFAGGAALVGGAALGYGLFDEVV